MDLILKPGSAGLLLILSTFFKMKLLEALHSKQQLVLLILAPSLSYAFQNLLARQPDRYSRYLGTAHWLKLPKVPKVILRGFRNRLWFGFRKK